ncbi:hypothetical protein PXH59_01955 [Xenorhabdus sp. SF857]|uniref:hypothetical protein n=1 Tax=Xenorhabdus bakwenae TaxID=3026967 RepID=UPI00255833A4|nr:hypothetical protein [Xenorhabdus sp. SF857]WFQ79981.1 hypothetical protein PXH59_01955 [Xenorhabdus sp. SF857]
MNKLMNDVKNNEYDRADFQGVYQGKSLIASAEIKTAPWEIGHAQPIVHDLLKKEGSWETLRCWLWFRA